jgi:succinate dehydrogenase / fumarate reductase, cytochrome b subunit
MSKGNFLESSIGRKIVMGLTGFFLIIFLLIHVTTNALIFVNDGGETFNTAAHFMSHNPIVQILEVGLFVGFLLHIYLSLKLTLQNNKARPVKYAMNNGNANSKWYSRSMGILGSLILIFLIVHLANFWIPTKKALYNDDAPHNTYEGMKAVFSWERWYFIALYLLGILALLYHLLHGFSSAFQSLGWNHRKYNRVIRMAGIIFSFVVCLLFAAMPISMAFGWVK